MATLKKLECVFSVVLHFFVKFIIPHVLIHSFDTFRIYNVNSHEKKGNSLNEKVCPNFWSVLYN